MTDYINGAANLAVWAEAQRNRYDVWSAFETGIPRVKYIATKDGQLHAYEYGKNSELRLSTMVRKLGIDTASILLAGRGFFVTPHAANMVIGSGTSQIFDQLYNNIKANPAIVDDFKKSLEPHFTAWVTINDQISSYIV